jgi:hypothetical protein
MDMPAIQRRCTTADVRALMDESRHWPRYELIDGELIVTPSPGVAHQVAVVELVFIVKTYLTNMAQAFLLLRPRTSSSFRTLSHSPIYSCSIRTA